MAGPAQGDQQRRGTGCAGPYRVDDDPAAHGAAAAHLPACLLRRQRSADRGRQRRRPENTGYHPLQTPSAFRGSCHRGAGQYHGWVMKADPNYPRMMFHPSKDPVTVHSEEQEAALGAEWSRTVLAALPHEHKPAKLPEPEPEEEPEEEEPDEEPEPEDPAEEPADHTETAHAPAHKPKRAKAPAHKPPHKTARKRT